MLDDHSKRSFEEIPIEEIPISQFKATCFALLAKVKRTGRPILVTRNGEPIAQVVPAAAAENTPILAGRIPRNGKDHR